eukprot:13436399-Alexandrium_andersonii.AAC.1
MTTSSFCSGRTASRAFPQSHEPRRVRARTNAFRIQKMPKPNSQMRRLGSAQAFSAHDVTMYS